MNTIRSQILIKNADENLFIQFIMDYLRYDRSPFLPLFISYKELDSRIENPHDVFYDWQISMYSNSSNEDLLELSKIHLSKYPGCLAVQFEYSDSNTNEIQEYIQKVGTLLKKYGFKLSFDNVKRKKNSIYVPTTKAALERWRETYSSCVEISNEYYLQEEKGHRLTPTMDEYVENVFDDTGIKYSKKSIQRIIRAGDADLLKIPK
jgi:hypothetical protein